MVAGLVASGQLSIVGFTAVSAAAALSCAPVPAGLVAWWPGDEQVTNLAGAPGMLKLGTTVVPGLVGQAFSFDGVDDYVDVGPGFDLDQITVDAWVNVDPATNTGDRRVISSDSDVVALPEGRREFSLKPAHTTSPASTDGPDSRCSSRAAGSIASPRRLR